MRAPRYIGAIITGILLLFPSALLADAVFLNNGRIIEGKIQQWNDARIVIRSGRKVENIPRARVIRVARDDRYKRKVYIQRKNGSTLHAHIVEERPAYYIIRRDLNRAREERVYRNKVLSVSRRPAGTPGSRGLKKTGHFNRHLGFRLGLSMQSTDMPASVSPERSWGLEPLFFQLYFYDRWFDLDLAYMPRVKRFWQNYARVEDVHHYTNRNGESSNDYFHVAVTGYPFRMFNLNLGITLGILHHRVDWFRTNNPLEVEIEYSSVHYQSVVLGVTWRFLNRFRGSVNVLIPYDTGFTYRDFTTGGGTTTHLVFTRDKPLPGFSINFAGFIVDNLTIEAGYQFIITDVEYKRETGSGPVNPFGQHLRMFSHRITFSAGYGFDL